MSFLRESCTFQVLNREILDNCEDFQCDNSDLNEFFLKDAVKYAFELLGKSYCFVHNDSPNKMVCAFSLSNDSIKLDLLPAARKNHIKKRFPYAKHFKSYPGVLIGRLGVNKEFQRMGIGKELIDFIKAWFIDKQNKTGCRFVIVDAYNDERAMNFYKKNGFDTIYSTENQERLSTGSNVKKLKTRLMFFDLMLLNSEIY